MTTTTHTPDPDAEISAFDTCKNCGHPIVEHWEEREVWVTMTGGNPECYGRNL